MTFRYYLTPAKGIGAWVSGIVSTWCLLKDKLLPRRRHFIYCIKKFFRE
jgi:hypothetical protein